jgi:hypothetical protein
MLQMQEETGKVKNNSPANYNRKAQDNSNIN